MSTKTITISSWTDFQPGDRIVDVRHRHTDGAFSATVERDVPDLPTGVGSIGLATVTFDGEEHRDVMVIRPAPDRLRAPWFLPMGKVNGFDFVSDMHISDYRPMSLVPDEPRPLPTRNELAEAIWEASRADEGTISATGANVVADRVLALLSGGTR